MNETKFGYISLQINKDDKEIQQLSTDKARLMHEVQRLMQTVEHLENTMTDSEDGHASEVNMAGIGSRSDQKHLAPVVQRLDNFIQRIKCNYLLEYSSSAG